VIINLFTFLGIIYSPHLVSSHVFVFAISFYYFYGTNVYVSSSSFAFALCPFPSHFVPYVTLTLPLPSFLTLADVFSHSSDFESRRRLRSASSLNLIVHWTVTGHQHMAIVRFLSLVLVSETVFYHTSNLRRQLTFQNSS